MLQKEETERRKNYFVFFNCRSHDVIFLFFGKKKFRIISGSFQNGVVTEVDRRLETGGYIQHLAAYTKNFTKKFYTLFFLKQI